MSNIDIALIISGVALFVSFVALWVNSLSPFKLKILHEPPTFSLHKITPSISGSKDGKTWWIPSFDIGISFHNVGRISGEILDVRIVAEFEGYRFNKRYLFYPKWIVDYSAFNKDRTERFQWLEKAIIREWYPILLKGQSDVNLHLVLEADRWDQKENGKMTYCLEVISSKKKKWIECGRYSLHVTEDMFDDKSCYTTFDDKIEELRKL